MFRDNENQPQSKAMFCFWKVSGTKTTFEVRSAEGVFFDVIVCTNGCETFSKVLVLGGSVEGLPIGVLSFPRKPWEKEHLNVFDYYQHVTEFGLSS